MFHFWFPGQHYIRLQTAGSTALNYNQLAKSMHKNRACFQERAQGWAGQACEARGAAREPAKPEGLRGLQGSWQSLRGPWRGWAGWSCLPPHRLEQVHPRHICNALTVRNPASLESSATQMREGLQGNRD